VCFAVDKFVCSLTTSDCSVEFVHAQAVPWPPLDAEISTSPTATLQFGLNVVDPVPSVPVAAGVSDACPVIENTAISQEPIVLLKVTTILAVVPLATAR